MIFRFSRILILLFPTLLIGCSNYSRTGPAVIEEAGTPPPPPVVEPAQRAEQLPPSQPERSVIVGQQVEPAQPVGNSAVDSLLEEGEKRFLSGDFEGAIATAERALRIDRLNPRVYLLIAKSYWANGALPQARQSATQGLQYTAENSYIREQLERYR